MPTFGAVGARISISQGSSAIVTLPTGITVGQAIVLYLFLDGSAVTINPPAGFSHVENSPAISTGSHQLAVMAKRADGSESGSSVTITWDGSTRYREAQAARFTSVVESGSMFDTPTAGAGESTNSTVTPALSITTAGADRLILHAATNWAGGTWTAGTGFTKRSTGAEDLFFGDKAQAVAGSTGSVTATCTGSDRRTAILLALKPAVSGAGQTVSPSSVASSEQFGTAIAQRGPVTVSPAGIAGAEAFGAASVSIGAQTVSPSGIASAEALGSATLATGAVTVAPSSVASGAAFGMATVQAGALTISPSSIAPTLETNLVTNPSAEVNTTGWNTYAGSVARVTTQQDSGVAAFALTANGSDGAILYNYATRIPVTPGRRYSASARFKAATISRTCRVDMVWQDAGSSALGSIGAVVGPAAVNSTADWLTRKNEGVTAPVGTTHLVVHCYVIGPPAAGEVHYIDSIIAVDGTTVPDYFDGGSAYSLWTGAAHASNSERLLPDEQFGVPTVSVSGPRISDAGDIASGEAVGSPTVVPGPVTVAVSAGIASDEQFGRPSVTVQERVWRLFVPGITEAWPMKGSLQTKLTRQMTVFGNNTVLYTSEDGYTNVAEFADEDGAIVAPNVWHGGRVNTTILPAIRDLWLAHGYVVEEVT